jgi:hypothetical protein
MLVAKHGASRDLTDLLLRAKGFAARTGGGGRATGKAGLEARA